MTPPKDKGLIGHNLSRQKVCAVCLKANSKIKLTEPLIDGLKKFTTIFSTISPTDERVPQVICDNCRIVLQCKIKGKGRQLKDEFKIPKDFSFDSVVLPKTRSADSESCNCLLCDKR